MKWKNFAPKMPWFLCVLLCALGIAAVMHEGVIVAQSGQTGVGMTVDPRSAVIAAGVMVLIGIQIFVFRRHHMK